MPTPAPARATVAVALLPPAEPLPPPSRTDPSRATCDLCGQASEQLWTLAANPAGDLGAGELLICRSCATAVRRPHRTPAPTPAARPRRQLRRSQLVPHAMAKNGSRTTLT